MTEKQKIALVVKAIRSYAQEHFGWSAKYHPEDLDKYNTLMSTAKELEEKRYGQPIREGDVLAMESAEPSAPAHIV
jgi:hypothetical protein